MSQKESSSEGLEAMQEIDEVVSLIKNGQWHNLKDIINKSKLPKPKVNKILEFLVYYDFIDLDRGHKKVKVTSSLTNFLKENQTY